MRALGVFPASLGIAWGIVDYSLSHDTLTHVDHGIVTPGKVYASEELRVSKMVEDFDAVINEYNPFSASFGIADKKGDTDKVVENRTIALVVLTQNSVPVFHYSQIYTNMYTSKKRNGIYGLVQERLHLSEVPKPTSAVEALALALCHITVLSNARTERNER